MTIKSSLPARGAIGWLPPDAPAAVVAARGLYLLKQWPAVVATLDTCPGGPEAETVRALAWARMGEFERALASFAAAVTTEPVDPHLRCAYAACLLRFGRGSEASAQVEAPQDAPASLQPTIHSLRGAACWRLGQEALAEGRDREAATQFERANAAFLAAAHHAATARRSLPERLAATYVGQGVAMIGAEQFAAATQLFARRRAQGMAVALPVRRFARDLYELCDLLPRLDPSERATAIGGLRPLVTGAAMAVQIWDGSQPVSVTWRGLRGRGDRGEGASHA